eukprot:gb/GECH01001599.1/.p1 GENE.gb/GECH01001599.1/~~gb/GECH01001599.1/.p1  ORF type:complete len:117 (+),score=32.10 gb/GECH01001599.1/:1-351(+)
MELVMNQELVSWVSIVPEFRFHNRNGNYISQGGVENANQGTTPFWDAGVTGKGQIVGCADSGIDYDNCFYDDPSTSIPLNTTNNNHRKIVSYRNVNVDGSSTDFQDYASGHGTHVV